jgi:hypothetical protein
VWLLDGCHAMAHLLVPSLIFFDPPTDGDPYTDGKFWGPRDRLLDRGGPALFQPPATDAADLDPPIWCGLPRVICLPICHDLPVGQCWDPAIGLEGFLASLAHMSTGVSSLQSLWSDCPLLHEWFAQAATVPWISVLI